MEKEKSQIVLLLEELSEVQTTLVKVVEGIRAHQATEFGHIWTAIAEIRKTIDRDLPAGCRRNWGTNDIFL